MTLPEFPTDEGTLGMIMLALDPGPEAERTSLSDLLDLMSQMGGSDTAAVSEVLHADPRDDDPYGSREDQPAWGPEIHVMRDPIYHEHDVLRALIAALRAERAQIEDVLAIDPADHATKSRDFGRGFAEALRQVRVALGAADV